MQHDIAILYHGGCPDGAGGAYAAWKKFGDTAEYIPLKRGHDEPKLDGKELYFIDFCYPKEIMEHYRATAKSVTVLDHHEGMRDVATSFPGVFDTSRSGATIAWQYFHPNTPTPKLLEYIEDGDLYRFALPDSKVILSYVYSSPLNSFEHWDTLAREMEDPTERRRMTTVGEFFQQYRQSVIDRSVNNATLVRFEGYECYLASGSSETTSDVGHALSSKRPPLALVVSAGATNLRVSLRGDGSVDVSKLAQRHGGNGHPNAAAFRIPLGNPVPWEVIETESGHEVTF